MNLLKTACTSAALAAGALFASAPETAEAQIRIGVGIGGYGHYGHGHRHYGGYYGRGHYGYPVYGYSSYAYPSYGYGRVWHDTSHYDYHPAVVVPHGNHYDVIPGHYHFHPSGHWH